MCTFHKILSVAFVLSIVLTGNLAYATDPTICDLKLKNISSISEKNRQYGKDRTDYWLEVIKSINEYSKNQLHGTFLELLKEHFNLTVQHGEMNVLMARTIVCFDDAHYDHHD